MFSMLAQWGTIQKIVLNTLLVSIPEEFYLVMFTYIMMGEFDYWKEDECKRLLNKWDYGRVFIPVIVGALLSNVLRYTGLDFNIVSLLSILSILVCIIAFGDILNNAASGKWIGKAFIFLLVGVITIFITEFLYSPFILYGTEKTVEDVNNDILLNFIFSLPSRLIEYSIIIFFIAKKRTLLKAKMSLIFESKISTALVVISLAFNFMLMFVMVKAVVYENILVNLSFALRLIIVVGTGIFPVLNILSLTWGIYNIKNRESLKQKQASENLGNLLRNIKLYTDNENYDNIKWKLNEISINIEEISEKLYNNKSEGEVL